MGKVEVAFVGAAILAKLASALVASWILDTTMQPYTGALLLGGTLVVVFLLTFRGLLRVFR